MKKHDFYFELPKELIAQYPLEKRSTSRLLVYRRELETYAHHQFNELAQFLNPGDLLVKNDTKVIPARLYGRKFTGGQVELLVERVKDEYSFLAHIKASKALKAGSIIQLDKQLSIRVLERQGDLFLCESPLPILDLLNLLGQVPLPSYITRALEPADTLRYQTLYARHPGSVAVPSAGLHFDEEVEFALQARGVHTAYTTLHVGAGTFQPVRCEDIKDHRMHQEEVTLSPELCAAVKTTKAAGKRVIAVGTTALRSLESGELTPGTKETDIFIYPGYEFKICDGLITNFHLPESTLLMLVSAFIGCQQTQALYQEAILKKYRFFSYGDANLLL